MVKMSLYCKSIYKIILVAILPIVLFSFNLYAREEPTAKTFFDLGVQHIEKTEYSEAIDAYKKAVQIKPSYVEAYITLGMVSSMLSRYDEAIEAFKKAAKLKPNNAEVFYNLGNAYKEVEKHEEAIEAFKQAVKINPNFAEAHYNLGAAYLASGDKPSAREEYIISLKN